MKLNKLKTKKRLLSHYVFMLFFTIFCTTITVQAQNSEITGIVTSVDDGMPIPGAAIIKVGTTTGAVTNFDGEYTIDAKRGDVLQFSYLGMVTKTITVVQSPLNVALESDIQGLDEVVLVGYGKVKKSDITGSVSSISAKQLTQTQSTSIAQAIQGRAAGVSVTKSSGQPGSTPTVRIRGVGTVNDADPLYIVDGVPINDITNINMDDAQSVEVLKDASATAIYGSRGANGVVLITTKLGSEMKPVISYKTYIGVENRIDNLEVMNAEQWATTYNEGKTNDGAAPEPAFADPSSLESYNWKDAVYRTGTIESHQLSISGGTEKASYYVSFGNLSQKGIVNNTSFKRTNFRVNNTYQIKPKIKVGHNLQYANSKTNSVASFGGNSNFKTAFIGYVVDPTSPIYNTDGSPARPLYSTEIRNPVGLTIYEQTPLEKESFLGNVFIEADLLENLTFRSNYGLEINNGKVDNFQPAYFISAEQNRPVNIYNLLRSESRVNVWSNTLNYNIAFKEKHSINALLGHELQKSDFNNVLASRSGIPDGVENPTLGAGAVDSSTNNGNIASSSLLSFFGRLNYNYDERYLFTGTYRLDGSSRFGKNNKYAQFPSLALAWNVHKEGFYNIDAINQLKFRVGWGETGNQNIPNSAIFSTLSTSQNYLLGNDETTVVGLAPLRPGNQDLKWETTTTTNIGLDLALLNNSITFTADYFVKTTSDMLLESPILQTSGYGLNPTVNAGEIENKGLEFSLNYKKNINDFFFSVGGNISIIDNKVLSLASKGSNISTGFAGNGFQGISRTEAGRSIASFYGLEAIGIFQNQDEIDNYASLPGTKPGDVKYRNLNGDTEINDSDRTFIGSPLPDFTYGFNVDMTYKQFDLTMFFQGVQGNDIFNATGYLLEGALDTNLSTEFLNRWTGEGTSNSVPRATFDGFANNNRLSSRFVEDGSYLRLKNIQIGYNFQDQILEKTFISKARIYLAGQNLFTITNYNGMDPELGVDETQSQEGSRTSLDLGIDRGRYPSTRTVSLGLDINF
ncbi:SusC/RagA family TonB-linked outer membrane protein [Mariniflexile sp. AS56]|uniref:SusC/RagA family TonB-linked outer membrane protein n=1 Tax=Mariniflexile sp. AS56 TaxID=3063957 RepID=UPI0026F3772C|nr:TonB-dependent receptor [Mariniflexile sp. AS56]MDO7173167.1 TonB-dependent receptor [Mariniflexile sp. AS56]